MALDPNIALGVKSLELPNQLAQYGQLAQIQNAQNQNQLAQYQLGSAQRAEKSQNMLADAYAQATDPATGKIDYNKLTGLLAAGGGGAQLPGIEKTRRETETAAIAQQKAVVELGDAKLKQSRQFLDTINPTDPNAPAEYIAWHEANHRDPILGPMLAARGVTADLSRKRIEDAIAKGPAEFTRLLNESKLGTEKFMEMNKPHYVNQDTGAGGRTLTSPGLGGAATVVPGSEFTKTMTFADRIAQKNANLAQQRLDQETATGVLTPQSLDVAANVYLQTGQLPQGMGKSASGLRTQVMNRATELSTGKPAADVAGGIVEAKQDVASRGKAVKDFSTGTQGRQVNAFNTAIDHLGTMDKLSDALQNGDIKAFNALGNTIARQTGVPAPTNFDAAKQIVTSEVIKAVVASGGGVTERQEAERNFANANSPAQLKGLINTYQDLLGGQLKSLSLQYENTTGRKDFDKKLTPAAQSVVARVRSESPATAATMSTVDQQALDWATTNPTDPRAAQIKQRLGR
jgi:hypothetical protein